MSLLSEIKRRNVIRVALAYAAVSWLLIQIVVAIEEPLSLPASFDTIVIVLLAITFPVAMILAWAYELTPEGIKPTASVTPEASIASRTGQRLKHITIFVLAAAVVVLLVDRFGLSNRSPATPGSIAVLPFDNLSPDRGDAFFAPGLHEEILNQLEKIQNLTVIARTTMIQYESSDKSLAEIADELNVEAVMEGSVRFNDGQVGVTAQLIEPSTGGHLWSETYIRPFEDVFSIEADIAMNVANAMYVEFSPEEQESIEEVPTESNEAYALYLEAGYLMNQGLLREELTLALQKLEEATAADPNFVDAWVRKAEANYVASMAFFPDNAEYWPRQRSALETALELDPNHPYGRVISARLKYYAGDLKGAYEEYLEARELAGRPINPEIPQALGYVSETVDDIKAALRFDPVNPNVSMFLIRAHNALGNEEEARAAYHNARPLFDNNWPGIGDYTWFLLGSVSQDEIRTFADSSLFPRLAELLQDKQTLATEFAAFLSGDLDDQVIRNYFTFLAAYLGEPELAWESFGLKRSTAIVWAWTPLFEDVRQLPEFREFLVQEGFVDVWREYGFPEEFCESLGQDDFVCH